MGNSIITQKGGEGNNSGVFAWKRYTAAKIFIDYIISDNIDDYPNNSTQDGYYYEIVKKDIENLTWAEINTIAQAGNANKLFALGDTKSITLTTGEIIYVQIADFNHDTLQDGTTAPISFIMKDQFNTTDRPYDADTNVGGWKDSVLRSDLNSTVLNTFPSDLQLLIKYTKKQRYNGGGSVSTLNTVYDKLWIPSEKELSGTYSNTGGSGEGTQYSIFTGRASRIKSREDSEGNIYWTASAGVRNSYVFVCVNQYGDFKLCDMDNYCGVVAGFCI